MSITKLAQSIELAVSIPDSEKKAAGKAIVHLNKLDKKLSALNKYMNIMYLPFKKYQTVSEKSVTSYRGAIWKYSNKIREDFEDIKKYAGYCVKLLDSFNSDTQVNEILNTLTDTVGDIEEEVEILFNVLTTWEGPSYKDNVIKAFESAKKDIAELRKMIFDRVIDYISNNILNSNWIDTLEDDSIKMNLKNREPYISQLYREREDRIKEYI